LPSKALPSNPGGSLLDCGPDQTLGRACLQLSIDLSFNTIDSQPAKQLGIEVRGFLG
jgi:hypothetical protein